VTRYGKDYHLDIATIVEPKGYEDIDPRNIDTKIMEGS